MLTVKTSERMSTDGFCSILNACRQREQNYFTENFLFSFYHTHNRKQVCGKMSESSGNEPSWFLFGGGESKYSTQLLH